MEERADSRIYRSLQYSVCLPVSTRSLLFLNRNLIKRNSVMGIAYHIEGTRFFGTFSKKVSEEFNFLSINFN